MGQLGGKTETEICRQLREAVEEKQWGRAVVLLRQHHYTPQHRAQVVQAAAKYAPRWMVSKFLPHCPDQHLHAVLDRLLSRHMWSEDGADDWAMACHVVPQCADRQLDSVLTFLMSRGLWQAVGVALQRGVISEARHSQVVIDASKVADLSCFQRCMLPHCAGDDILAALSHLVERDLLLVENIVSGMVTSALKEWVLTGIGNSATGNRADIIYSSLADTGKSKDTIDTSLADTGKSKDTIDSSELDTGNKADTINRSEADTGNRADTIDSGETVGGNNTDAIDSREAVTGHRADTNDSSEAATGNRADTIDSGEAVTADSSEADTGNRADTNDSSQADTGNRAETGGNKTYTDGHSSATINNSNDTTSNRIDTAGNSTDTIDNCRDNTGNSTDSTGNSTDTIGNSTFTTYYMYNTETFVNTTYIAGNKTDTTGKNTANPGNKTDNTGNKTDTTRTSLWKMIGSCRVDVSHTIRLFGEVKRNSASTIRRLAKELDLAEDLCEVLYTSVLHRLYVMLCNDVTVSTSSQHPLGDGMRQLYDAINACIRKDCKYRDIDGASSYRFLKMKQVTASLPPDIKRTASYLPFLFFLENFNMYYTSRRGKPDDDILLTMLAVAPLFSELQSVALNVMLRHKRWDIISHASLSRVWEQDRRHLLQSAVKQRQWSVVKRWADHTLYDDQRVWVLNQALTDKQWDVVLVLADYGLTDIQLMRVHYRLAKYADWDVVLSMFERGGDVAEVRELLSRELAEIRTRYLSGKVENTDASAKLEDDLTNRHLQLLAFEKTMNKRKNVSQAIKDCDWRLLLFSLIRSFSRNHLRLALKAAVKKKAWRAVIQLVRFGMDTVQRDSLFSKMMRRRQWGVCRALLEQGLSVHLCLDALPQLMERHQWTLVARVMEHDVGDDVRQKVMLRAWERREGSVVWLCIKSLPTPLSVEEREALFQRAFSCQLWQVVKPLVEEKDEAGIRHRDTALLEAIEQHQWDVVDHCQRHHADINMKDDDGHTPLQRAAMKRDWEGVEELVVRDGDPNLLDTEGYSAMHRATNEKQWDTVKLLIQFHGDIHQPAKPRTARASRIHVNRTPLQMLIVARQGELIEHTLMWSPEQSRGVSVGGETALHALCLSGWYTNLQYVLARGVDPLALTKNGHSVLMYAVLTKDCPQRMVAECIRLGFSTHQPSLTVLQEEFAEALTQATSYPKIVPTLITSPFLFSVLRGLPVVTQMLYESGSCSRTELRWLLSKLSEVVDQDTEEVKKRVPVWRFGAAVQNYLEMIQRIQAALPQLRRMATTPRTLMSACRLVVSHSLDVRGKRQRDVEQLGVLEYYEDYLLFSDLAHQDYGKFNRAW